MKLYKYSPQNGINILKNEKIKITPPNDFNDPFEFLVREKTSKGVSNNPLMVNAWAQSYIDKMSKVMGVLCFSKIPNSLLMWSHYCDGLKGIVIEFDTSDETIKEYWKSPYRVFYSHKRFRIARRKDNTIKPERDIADLITTKGKEWKYEKEYRYIFRLKDCDKLIENEKTKYYTGITPKMITRVILGEKCDKEIFEETKNILKESKFSHIEHSVALRCPNTYKINILDNTGFQKLLTKQSSGL